MLSWRFPAVLAAAVALAGTPSFAADVPETRPFLMGFTPWPSDLTPDGFEAPAAFARGHGDIISVMFIGGIPWPEALDGKPFSKSVKAMLGYRTEGPKLFLAISPLNKQQTGLASYWGEEDNRPLPAPWNRLALNSPEVKKAYLNFVVRAVEGMNPNYLAIGIGSNALLSHVPDKWKQLKELHHATYVALKEKYPGLPVFFTTDVLHYKKLVPEAKAHDQEGEVADLMKDSDYFAMTVYPHLSPTLRRPIPSDFLDFATKFKKPVAVADSGMSSRTVTIKAYQQTLRGSEADQKQFTEVLLRTAARDDYVFVINFATTDFEKLCKKFPFPLSDLARTWAFTGMQTDDKKAKPALAVWEAYFKARYQPPK
jgi:hypothetical protein